MNEFISQLIDDIARLPSDWHGAGSVSPKVLRAIAEHVQQIGAIQHSVETGSGRTTLLFSHLSDHHLVFAFDAGKSISQVKSSPLLNTSNVTFIEGSTQITLPKYSFSHKIQVALIDGPHAYPFPDLEYYYFYPLLEAGGLLLVDDTRIPSISRMFEILKADDMFDLLEVVDNMAFLKRSRAPLLDPLLDNWRLQGYNRRYYEQLRGSTSSASTQSQNPPQGMLPRLARMTPQPLKNMIPTRLKNAIRHSNTAADDNREMSSKR